ncbi:DUF2158 domain-containing protein (plasmid) [Yersinia ruckeri]|nr:DUF2158 domain-containing protein [Yersinia ruckeri]
MACFFDYLYLGVLIRMCFRIGDIVYIKSEQKEMTVADFNNYNTPPVVLCVWLDKYMHVIEYWFPIAVLEKKTPRSS